ncbi:hypothetical protein Tco_0040710 [Tanacetum coccineum]
MLLGIYLFFSICHIHARMNANRHSAGIKPQYGSFDISIVLVIATRQKMESNKMVFSWLDRAERKLQALREIPKDMKERCNKNLRAIESDFKYLQPRWLFTDGYERAFKIQRIFLTGFPAQSVGSSNTDVLDSPCLLVLITGTSQSRQHESCKSSIAELFEVDSERISIRHCEY